MTFRESRTGREFLLSALRRYLVGPIEDSERINERASDRYHTGYLSPCGAPLSEEEDDQIETADDGDSVSNSIESILSLANVSQQSAMGMTFQVKAPGDLFLLEAVWAEYAGENDAQGGTVWKRTVQQIGPLSVPIASRGRLPVLREIVNGVEIRVTAELRDDVRVVTASLLNSRPKPTDRAIDNNIYQVGIRVYSRDRAPIFVARPPSSYVLDSEFWNHELLYSHVKQYAVGHGCAVEWLASRGADASEVWTEWIPQAEVFKASADVVSNDPILRLASLSDTERRSETCDGLLRVAEHYESWISRQLESVPTVLGTFPMGHRENVAGACRANLDACRTAAGRIRDGILVLRENAMAWQSFCMANQAISLGMRKSRPGVEPQWFAFQLAFFLVTLRSLVEPHHDERNLMDLIWFPTGGGKTEAYLGIAAFCLFYRRLNAKTSTAGLGTAVITRYTLRLLTIQQFERAARAVCACEVVRRKYESRLGPGEFSIGLYVGSGATPNSIEDARRILAGAEDSDAAVTTLPLIECPWCGAGLSTTNQKIDGSRLITSCPRSSCDFNKRLPVLVVDEEIYAFPPSILIGTIDKFARMPWEPRIRSIFGSVETPPPELIIQDELHLISDALGTVAALYETAIDYLCTKNGSRPKLIGSTATIRRASEQALALFERGVAQFPPSGLSSSDSFFYSEDRAVPGRLYVGVHAQGRSPKYTLARVLGILSQAEEQVTPDSVRDQYFTLVAYFNSLRELGGALVLAEDDVPRYVDAMPGLDASRPRRRLLHVQELTSHLPQRKIPEILRHLAVPIPSLNKDDDLSREPLDLVLATNMISVGVDVNRLGIMIVNGQPKTTSEYIQASSRVGRPKEAAGLVVTLYNWTRPRDRSHYERFVAYHQAFYRFVESSSVTPFAARARDRALHAVVFSLARLMVDTLSDNDGAGRVLAPTAQKALEQFGELIKMRVNAVDASELDDTAAQIAEIIETWAGYASTSNLYWRRPPQTQGRSLLRAPEMLAFGEGVYITPQSMRDVEPPASVRLLTKAQLEATAN